MYESERQAMEAKLWSTGEVEAMERLLQDEVRMEDDGSAMFVGRSISQIMADVVTVLSALTKEVG